MYDRKVDPRGRRNCTVTGQPKQAIEVLERVLARHPYDRDTLSALVAYAREQSRPRQALAYARRLADVEPTNAEVRQLVERLEAEGSGSHGKGQR
jgi:cytochrome c-type biogenesis protein CcmH/NrfG